MTELITVAELAAALAALCRDHPELSDRHVFVPAEYGYSGACIAKPFTALVDTFHSNDHAVVLHSNDDNLQPLLSSHHMQAYAYPAPNEELDIEES